MYYVGAHVSAAGGAEKAVQNALSIGANAFAFFTKNQKQWRSPPLTEEHIAHFQKALQANGFTAAQVLPHDGYLINLGNPDDEKRRISVASFIDEMRRVQQLGLDRLNLHPGAHLNSIDADDSLLLISQGIDEALSEIENVYAVVETTAGQGSALGSTFEELARIIERSKYPERIGVCIDTCHIFAAGYDIRSDEGFFSVIEEFERMFSFSKLMGVHINDAKNDLGSKVDRHASLGKGKLGLVPFELIMRDRRFEDIPLILETPDPSLWSEEITLLRSFIHQPDKELLYDTIISP